MSFLIRPVNFRDAATLATLHEKAFKKGFWKQPAFENILSNIQTLAYGALVQNELKGFLLAQIVLDEIEILTLAVDPLMQGQGLGLKLMEELLTQAVIHGAKNIFLEVHEENTRALYLYQTLGFKKVGERPNYYKNLKGISGPAFMLKKEIH